MPRLNSQSASATANRRFARRAGSAASWWVYYFDEGKNHYITAIPLEKHQALGHARAATKYCRGRHIAQITETPPNDES